MVPGFLRKEQSVSGVDKLRIEPHHNATKYIEEMLNKGRNIR